MGLWEKGRKSWWCGNCGEKYDWKQPNRLLVVQTGESVNQGKVFRAHEVPQGFCANLINASKLLANQQEDGDGLIQNIVTNFFCDGSREGLTNGLREFIKIDNHRALEVGHLNEGLGTLKVRRPKGSEGYPEVLVRESPNELTLRGSGYVEVIHQCRPHRKGEVGSSSWLILTGMPSVRRCTKASKEKTRESYTMLTKK